MQQGRGLDIPNREDAGDATQPQPNPTGEGLDIPNGGDAGEGALEKDVRDVLNEPQLS
jgi:hypothetical protein